MKFFNEDESYCVTITSHFGASEVRVFKTAKKITDIVSVKMLLVVDGGPNLRKVIELLPEADEDQ